MKNAINYQEYVYDVAVDGGGTATYIELSNNNNKAAIPVGAVIKSVFGKVVTACTSTGSAQIGWGTTSDPNGYSGDIEVASLTDNAVFNGWDSGAALIWDDSNDHPIFPAVTTAATGSFVVTVGTAALATGKIVFGVEYALPTLE